jgi:hypothetical protein
VAKEVKKFEGGYNVRPYFKGPMPLASPRSPLQVKQDIVLEDKSKPTNAKTQSIEEKLAALIAYMMARGICRKCGDKWFRNHKCVESV